MEFNIAQKHISQNTAPFIIAEAGINHNGNLKTAFQMIDIAKECGVDCIKFQTFKAEEFCGDKNQTYTYKSQGHKITESMYEMFKRMEFNPTQWHQIKQYCDDKDVIFMSTPQNASDLDLLIDMSVPAIKVGSDDFINIPLLNYYKTKNLPILLSCGMADLNEIKIVLRNMGYPNFPLALLLCTSQYPTPLEDINLNKLITLRKEFPNLILGFSDHSQGELAATIAVGMGAVIFEKHFTLSHDMPGPDHWFSSNPSELKSWVQHIRQAYITLGNKEIIPTQKELEMRNIARRKIIAAKDIKKGEIISDKDLTFKRASQGVGLLEFNNIIGKRALKAIPAGTPILKGDYCD